MTRRLRIAHVLVQPVLVWDDGEELEPGPSTQPQQVPLKALALIEEQLKAQLADLESQLLAESSTSNTSPV